MSNKELNPSASSSEVNAALSTTTPARPSSNPPPKPTASRSRSLSRQRGSSSKPALVNSPSSESLRDASTDSLKKRRSVSFSRMTDEIPHRRTASSASDSKNPSTTIPKPPKKRAPSVETGSPQANRDRSISRGRKSARSPERRASKVSKKSSKKSPKEDAADPPAPPIEKKEEVVPQPEEAAPAVPEKPKVKRLFDHIGKLPEDFSNHMTSVKIHSAEALKANVHIRHPVVRVSFLDFNTGKFLQKSKMDRKTTYSNESSNLGYILPCMTQIYSFTEHGVKAPQWEEEIIFNEDYLHLVSDNVIAVFELMDFITSKRKLISVSDGWYKIAWAFLKVVGGDKLANTESKVRLQLYYYPLWNLNHIKRDQNVPTVYHAFKSKRVRYPSSLYVTIKGVPRPDVTFVKARSRLPTEIEVGKATLDQLLGVSRTKKRSQDSLTRSVVNLTNKRIWRYEVGLPFKIPNKLLYAFDTGNRGAFSCSFSHNGIYLAIACVGAENYPIKVYDILTGERVATLDGHCDLVYQLSWSDNDEELLSASSDASVRIWTFNLDGTVNHTGTLQHPSFVYCSVFHPAYIEETRMVATGSYDGHIRIWTYDSKHSQKPSLKLTLTGHKANVNSLLFNHNGLRLYSADALGTIKVWNSSKEDVDASYHCTSTVDIFMGIPINSLSISPNDRDLLVHTSSNTLHILDTRIMKISTNIDKLPQPFMKKGLPNSPALAPLPNLYPSFLKRSRFSPCGAYILSESIVYEVASGLKWGNFDLGKNVVDVAWHPQDFTVCFVEYGGNGAKVYTYDENSPSIRRYSTKPLPKPKAETAATSPQKVEALSNAFHRALETLKLGKDLKKEVVEHQSANGDIISRYVGNDAKTVSI